MGRIRTIKPEFWTSETLSSVSAEACLLAAALLNYCDDEGYFNARPELIKAACFPIRSTPPIRRLLVELSTIGYIQIVERSSKTVGLVMGFRVHQRVDRAQLSRLRSTFETPDPINGELLPVEGDKGVVEASTNDRRGLVAGMEGKVSGNGIEKQFDEFWEGYPRKVGKGDALASWKKLSPADRTLAASVVTLYAQSRAGEDLNFTPHASKWLNARRFEDDKAAWANHPLPPVVDPAVKERYEAALRRVPE